MTEEQKTAIVEIATTEGKDLSLEGVDAMLEGEASGVHNPVICKTPCNRRHFNESSEAEREALLLGAFAVSGSLSGALEDVTAVAQGE